MDEAAKRLGLRLHVLHASTEQEFGAVFDALHQVGASGLAFTSDPFYANRSQQLARLSVRHGIPAVHQSRDFTLAGGLMSYGGNFVQSHQQAGAYAGRILRGEKPSDLPVRKVTGVELFINLKAAKALGITVPRTLLTRADEVIAQGSLFGPSGRVVRFNRKSFGAYLPRAAQVTIVRLRSPGVREGPRAA